MQNYRVCSTELTIAQAYNKLPQPQTCALDPSWGGSCYGVALDWAQPNMPRAASMHPKPKYGFVPTISLPKCGKGTNLDLHAVWAMVLTTNKCIVQGRLVLVSHHLYTGMHSGVGCVAPNQQYEKTPPPNDLPPWGDHDLKHIKGRTLDDQVCVHSILLSLCWNPA